MGWARWPFIATAVGVWMVAGVANAHELDCEKRVNGVQRLEVSTYPTTLTWTLRIWNVHPNASTAQTLSDPLLESLGFTFNPAAPLTLPPGGEEDWSFSQTVQSWSDCLALAEEDGRIDERIDNVFSVTWDVGEAHCPARVVCGDQPPPPPPPPNGTRITRTMGFFKTHMDALEQCVDEGPIDLGPGFDEVDTLEEALGLLWASPSRFDDGTRRNALERARFLLARQTLVGVCNVRLFDAEPTPSDLIDDALAALQDNNCAELHDLADAVDAFNNSGTGEDFPAGFEPGPATPQDARELADDPSNQTGGACAAVVP